MRLGYLPTFGSDVESAWQVKDPGSGMDASSISARTGEVDALRCFAMLSVIAIHAQLFPLGWIGVWLFYVISGYVVTLSILRRRATSDERESVPIFFRRRIARIVPLYYAYLCIGLIVAATRGSHQDSFSIASLFLFYDNVTMIQGLGLIKGWASGHLWTLSVEMQFYLAYGFALCLLPLRSLRTLLVALLVICPLARFAVGSWLAAQGWPPAYAAFAVYAAPGLHFDLFAMGGLIAFAEQDGVLKRLARPLFVGGVAALLVYCAAYSAVNMLVRDRHGVDVVRDVISGILFGEQREVFLYSAIGFAMAGLVALAAARDPLIRPLLGSRLVQRIGEISYGGYVFHHLGLMSASALLGLIGLHVRHGGAVPHVVMFLLGTVLTILAAEASFRWFETPCRRWIDGARRRDCAFEVNGQRLEAR